MNDVPCGNNSLLNWVYSVIRAYLIEKQFDIIHLHSKHPSPSSDTRQSPFKVKWTMLYHIPTQIDHYIPLYTTPLYLSLLFMMINIDGLPVPPQNVRSTKERRLFSMVNYNIK